MKSVNWTKWSSIAEIVSSIAILITLLYLAIQTEQSTDAINSQSRQSLLDSAQFEQSLWLQYPQLTAFVLDNSLEMTLEEKVQLDSLMILALTRREFAYRQYQAGVLDENIWIGETEIISLLLGTERNRVWWNTIGHFAFEQDFVDAAQSVIEGQPLHDYWKGFSEW
jgi:hypothetical protein